MAPHVPPLDLQGVGGRAAAAEGAGHLHVLACPRRHVVGRLCEQGCANKQEGVGRNSQGSGNGRASRGEAGGLGEADRAGVARPAGGNGLVSGGAPGEALPGWAEGHVAAAGKTQEGRSRPKALNAPFRLGPDPGACRRCGRLCRGVRDQRRAGLQNVSEEARRPERKLLFLLILPDFSNCFHPDSLPGSPLLRGERPQGWEQDQIPPASLSCEHASFHFTLGLTVPNAWMLFPWPLFALQVPQSSAHSWILREAILDPMNLCMFPPPPLPLVAVMGTHLFPAGTDH